VHVTDAKILRLLGETAMSPGQLVELAGFESFLEATTRLLNQQTAVLRGK
jgi:hypothetical protein